ncbi:hypothetical protein EXS70_05050 [Candidatus Peribacteria bacterium]|nr:hypothetical protein [Candidatus Peribacteria bacterium]
MGFLNVLYSILFYDTVVLSVPLFFISLVMLTLGMTIKVWAEALNLGKLEHRPLDWIERTHPHIPSMRTVITVNLSVITLCAVGLQSLRNVPPFNDPFQGLNLLTLFVLAGSLGTLGELQWRKAKTLAYAFILGTGFAFLCLALFITPTPMPVSSRVLLGFAAVATAVIAGDTLRKDSNRMMAVCMTIVVFAFWIVTYLIQ